MDELEIIKGRLAIKIHEVKCLDTLKEAQKTKITEYEKALRLAVQYIAKTDAKGAHKIINYIEITMKG